MVNKTSLRFIFAFIAIVACTIGFMEILSRIENVGEDTSTQRAGSAETDAETFSE